MTRIHPTAIIEDGAQLGADVTVGAFSIVERDTVIGAGTRIGACARVYAGTRLGARCFVGDTAAIGGPPQALAHDASIATWLEVGDDTEFHECCTVHRGTAESYTTRIGARCRLHANAHVAHDAQVGNDVVFEDFAGVAGHVHVGDHTIIRFAVAAHQFTHIGSHCEIGSWITKDVPPFLSCMDQERRALFLNESLLRSRGLTDEHLRTVRDVFRILYESGLNVSQAVDEIAARMPDDPHANTILAFIRNSRRGLVVGKLQ
jgi:UDP-N-acetylglucosamine acyltransferase